MSHWRDKFPSKFLRADDIGDEVGDSIDAMLKRVTSQKVGRGDDTEKWVAEFKEAIKPLVLNTTNCKSMERLSNSGDPSQWRDIRIQLFLVPTFTPSGEETLGIRIRAPKTKAVAPKTRRVATDEPVDDDMDSNEPPPPMDEDAEDGRL